jgi:16S rRNA (adenine1518-N6/adenine1519-N6)-dimethyltransferase
MRQKHGQNFLIDNNIVNNIIRAARLEARDSALEIGPGKGILTKALHPLVKRVLAVEIDKELSRGLSAYFNLQNTNNVKIITADFLKLPFENGSFAPGLKYRTEAGQAAGEISDKFFRAPFKIVSNLPYNVGTAIVQKFLPLKDWTTAVIMLQKEAAKRLAANPGGKDYGYISIFTQYYADAQILFDVSPRCFAPQPEIVSSVLRLTNKLPAAADKLFFDFVKHAFGMRRKTILNSLSSFDSLRSSSFQSCGGGSNKKPDKIKAGQILKECRLDPMLRPDKLSIEDFLNIASKII